jgi:hypothetical protein
MITRYEALSLFAAAAIVLATVTSVAAAAGTNPAPACIPFSEAFDRAERRSSEIPAELLPALPFGWAWIQEYEIDLNDEERWHWLSWPDGVDLTPC